MPVELVPLGTFRANLSAPHAIPNGPLGTRMVFDASDGCLEGDRIRATQLGTAAADWLTVGPDGVGTLDVRVTLVTDDGAVVLVTYRGRADFSAGTDVPVYIAPLFETSDERYRWLNVIQAVGKGRAAPDASSISYELYEVR